MAGELAAVTADADATPEGVDVDLTTDNGTFTLTVPPAGRWRSRATTALNNLNFEVWAQLTLSAEDLEAWKEADPRIDEINAFFVAWERTAGESRGKSAGSNRSSRRTARR